MTTSMHRFLLALAGFAIGFGFGCRNVDPDKGIYSCSTTPDCGPNFECRPLFGTMNGRCFTIGFCKDEETCNGLDDNCDGRTDETFPMKGAACTTTQQGVCSAGTRVCTLGAELCEATKMPSTELCNGLDDDCDGQTDENFDLMTDSANCSACGRACGTGTICRQASCVESNCGDGTDNDQNGKSDCNDEVCLGFDCNTQLAPASRCGFAPVIPDAGFDAGSPDGGDADAGTDAGLVDAGLVDAGLVDAGLVDAGLVDGGFVRGCFRPETACDDGFDNDGDGVADCADSDCDNRVCFTGQTCTMRRCPGPG